MKNKGNTSEKKVKQILPLLSIYDAAGVVINPNDTRKRKYLAKKKIPRRKKNVLLNLQVGRGVVTV